MSEPTLEVPTQPTQPVETPSPPANLQELANAIQPEVTPSEPVASEPAPAPVKFDATKYEKAFEESGQLSDEHYQELEDFGLPRQVVDDYIAGRVASTQQQGAQFVADTLTQAGVDHQQFEAVSSWARQSLAAEDRTAYNKAVQSGDPQIAAMAVKMLNEQFVAANGRDPALTTGSNQPSSGDVYESKAQALTDVTDPRYTNDPAFRKKVEEKVSRSKDLHTRPLQ